jgi:hypothetical protein
MPPIEFLRGVIDAGARKSTDTRLSRRMTQPFGYLKFPASFIVIIIGCLIFADGNAFADYFSSGDHTITLKQGDCDRSAIVHVPLRASERRDIPVVLRRRLSKRQRALWQTAADVERRHLLRLCGHQQCRRRRLRARADHPIG